MAPYLTMMAIGEFDVDTYTIGGIRAWDALDPDLFATPLPTTGDQFAYSQQGDFAYKRLTRTIAVPASGAQLSFWVDYETEKLWDYVFVEAHTAGSGRLDDPARPQRPHRPGHRLHLPWLA